jgi:hypothetical protein
MISCVLSGTFWETVGCIFAEIDEVETHVLASSKSGAVVKIVGANNIVDYDRKWALHKLWWMIEHPYSCYKYLPLLYEEACVAEWKLILFR